VFVGLGGLQIASGLFENKALYAAVQLVEIGLMLEGCEKSDSVSFLNPVVCQIDSDPLSTPHAQMRKNDQKTLGPCQLFSPVESSLAGSRTNGQLMVVSGA